MAACEKQIADARRSIDVRPDDLNAKAGLANELERLAEIKSGAKDFSGALAALEERLRILMEISNLRPEKRMPRRRLRSETTLADSISKTVVLLTELKSKIGDYAGAMKTQEEHLKRLQEHASQDPNEEIQKDISRSFERLREVKRAAGDLTGALAIQKKNVDLLKRLASNSPGQFTPSVRMGRKLLSRLETCRSKSRTRPGR